MYFIFEFYKIQKSMPYGFDHNSQVMKITFEWGTKVL